jgi:hypothetical protein
MRRCIVIRQEEQGVWEEDEEELAAARALSLAEGGADAAVSAAAAFTPVAVVSALHVPGQLSVLPFLKMLRRRCFLQCNTATVSMLCCANN